MRVSTDLVTIPVRISTRDGKPVKNVTKTPLVAGQWQRQANGKYDLVICQNKTAPEIPVGGQLKLLG